MADIRTILLKLNESNIQAYEYAQDIIRRYPGTKVRWEKHNGHRFIDQIESMAAYVGQFSARYSALGNEIAVRIIDRFRVKEGQPTMMESLKDKTPTKKDVCTDPGPLYFGPHPWAKLMLDAEELSYDNQAEDLYLSIVNDRNANERIKKELGHLIKRKFTLQSLSGETAFMVRTTTQFSKIWNGLRPVQRAYAIRGILDHFLPDITDQTINVKTLLVMAIMDEPALKRFIPLSCTKQEYENLSNPPPPTTPMSNDPTNHYSDTPVARPTLIYGEDIDLMDDEELISATKQIQLRITKLKDIPGNSRKIKAQIQEAENAMQLVVTKLDADLPPEQI